MVTFSSNTSRQMGDATNVLARIARVETNILMALAKQGYQTGGTSRAGKASLAR
ncbi:hypothetical protein [Anoxybacteroides tepidamans]|uniref:hypothetical protein n=1 Tax=Anoxybacteroides tepidamans TaxID=265948 RepID=UPI0012EB42D0|nr:hypothetical protein [Anoxybacillus tepidamans]